MKNIHLKKYYVKNDNLTFIIKYKSRANYFKSFWNDFRHWFIETEIGCKTIFWTCLFKLLWSCSNAEKTCNFIPFSLKLPKKLKKGWRTQNVLTAAVECSFTSINSLIYFWYTKEALCEIEIEAFGYWNHIFKELELLIYCQNKRHAVVEIGNLFLCLYITHFLLFRPIY